jgi:hypothetical protein
MQRHATRNQRSRGAWQPLNIVTSAYLFASKWPWFSAIDFNKGINSAR